MARGRPAPDGRFASADRGQTLHDYALGISVFVVAVGVVFTFVPTLLGPFAAPIETSQAVQADRAATQVLHEVSVEDASAVMAVGPTETYFDGTGPDELRSRLGLGQSTRINVSVLGSGGVVASGGVTLRAGDVYHERTAATSVRVVALDHPGCDPTCRLVVRVW